tara:strand:- start:5713 stop:5964 length:252 start_codon:yes stop_codon:yes gene_type:complete
MLLNINARIIECEENGWYDLLDKLEEIIQSLVDNPTAGRQIRTALLYWKDAVDCRSSSVPPDEQEIIIRNPIMNTRQEFGTET